MVILVVFNSFNVVKNLKKPDPVARQMPPFYTASDLMNIQAIKKGLQTETVKIDPRKFCHLA